MYFAAAQKDVDAFDLAVGTVSVLLLALQLVASVYAVRSLSRAGEPRGAVGG